jgi:3-isopropylmalate/(R)-2-methylmalate dehydratase small subunit
MSMEPFIRVSGVAVPYLADDVNTDEITPVHRGLEPDFAELLFARRRLRADGTRDPEFPFNKPQFESARIAVVGRNFGCGSSRESAVWAMRAVGIRAIVARSFADLYRDNMLKNGLLPVVLDPAEGPAFEEEVVADNGRRPVTVDLEECSIVAPSGRRIPFEIDPAERTTLLEGLDEIGMTLREADAIAAFEDGLERQAPWLQHIATRERGLL